MTRKSPNNEKNRERLFDGQMTHLLRYMRKWNKQKQNTTPGYMKHWGSKGEKAC